MKASSVVILTLTFVTTLIVASSLSAQQVSQQSRAPSAWPMFQHDPQHTGQSSFTGITTTPVLKWTTQLPGYLGEMGAGMSTASDGTIYVSASGNLSAINPDTGAILWTFTGGNFSRSTAAIDDRGLIYWGFADTFVAITPTGEIAWGWPNLSWNPGFGSSPVISGDGSIYFNHDALFAFSGDGTPQWLYSFGDWSHASPAIGSDGTIYTSSYDGSVYAFAPNGKVKWQDSIGTYDSSPSVGSMAQFILEPTLGSCMPTILMAP